MNNFPNAIKQKLQTENKNEALPKKFHVDSDYEQKHDSAQRKALIERVKLLKSRESPTEMDKLQLQMATRLLGEEAVAQIFASGESEVVVAPKDDKLKQSWDKRLSGLEEELNDDTLSTKDRRELEEYKLELTSQMEKEVSDSEKKQSDLDSQKEQDKIDKNEATREERESRRNQKLDQMSNGLPSRGINIIAGGSQDAEDNELYHETVIKPKQENLSKISNLQSTIRFHTAKVDGEQLKITTYNDEISGHKNSILSTKDGFFGIGRKKNDEIRRFHKNQIEGLNTMIGESTQQLDYSKTQIEKAEAELQNSN
jgi:hypothetical protein